MPKCVNCPKPAKKTVVYLGRRSRTETGRAYMCDDHVAQELTLATSGLSMVDIEIGELVND